MTGAAGWGHDHFWERAITRRSLFGGTAGAVAAATVGPSATVLADGADPKPIPGGGLVASVTGVPGGPEPFHVYAPNAVDEPASITDFDGVTGWAHHVGTGTGTVAGVATPMTFDTDMRFQDGLYVGVDGRTRRGTFGFI